MAKRDSSEKQGRLRRAALLISAAALAVVLFVVIVFIKPDMPDRITLLTGPDGSAYHELGLKYAVELKENGLGADVVVTDGGLDNLEKLAAGAPNAIGFAPSNIEHAVGAGVDASELVSLGSVAYEPLWLFHNADLEINGIGDLAGLRVGIGGRNTVVGFVAQKLLASSAVVVSISEFESPESASDALIAGDVDACFLIGAHDSPVISGLLGADSVTFTSVDRADAFAARMQGLAKLVAPEGLFDLARNVPPEDAELLAATTNLVTRADLHPAVAPMVLNAAAAVHTGGIFSAGSTFPSEDDVSLPLKSSAKRYFTQGEKGLSNVLPYPVVRFLNHLGFVVLPLLTVTLIILKAAPMALKLWFTIKLMGYFRRLVAVEKAHADGGDPSELLARLDEIDGASVTMFVPRSRVHDYIDLRQFLHDMRGRLMSQDDPGA